jgi:3-phosphoshikimate 1-carboxyvinyltransferase
MMETLQLTHPSRQLHGNVQLTGSKSECNRALILEAWSKGQVKVENHSDAADTVTLMKALQAAHQASKESVTTIDIGPAGTAMRFLTAYLSTLPGQFLLTGSARMQQRPIGLLVDALRELGADIHYAQNEGYPPLKIQGPFVQKTSEVHIAGDISSQYLSALLLIGPTLPLGLDLHIVGPLTSKPYLVMTLDILSSAGIEYTWTNNHIHIPPQSAKQTAWYVEPDWSAATYWYSMVALSESGRITLPGLRSKSLQADREIAEIMTHFGVKTTFTDAGIQIKKTTLSKTKTHFDFKNCPDLAQTVVVCAAALQQDVSFTGLETLKIKETDRIAALQNELQKIGVQFVETSPGVYQLHSQGFQKDAMPQIATYEDHRMAMAFAPLALVLPKVIIEEPEVVAKSYPDYWLDLGRQGFVVH